MTKDEMIKTAIKEALAGGRRFGTAEHRNAIQYLADCVLEAETPEQKNTAVNAIVEIGNLSALQQKLEKAGAIDRNKKGEVSKNLFADLATFMKPKS